MPSFSPMSTLVMPSAESCRHCISRGLNGAPCDGGARPRSQERLDEQLLEILAEEEHVAKIARDVASARAGNDRRSGVEGKQPYTFDECLFPPHRQEPARAFAST